MILFSLIYKTYVQIIKYPPEIIYEDTNFIKNLQ